MSLLAHPESVDGNKHAKLQIERARKRKLAELWAVTAAEPALPQRPPPAYLDNLKPDSPLAIFLDQNDISLGRYFDVSTLPRRPDYLTKPTTSHFSAQHANAATSGDASDKENQPSSVSNTESSTKAVYPSSSSTPQGSAYVKASESLSVPSTRSGPLTPPNDTNSHTSPPLETSTSASDATANRISRRSRTPNLPHKPASPVSQADQTREDDNEEEERTLEREELVPDSASSQASSADGRSTRSPQNAVQSAPTTPDGEADHASFAGAADGSKTASEQAAAAEDGATSSAAKRPSPERNLDDTDRPSPNKRLRPTTPVTTSRKHVIENNRPDDVQPTETAAESTAFEQPGPADQGQLHGSGQPVSSKHKQTQVSSPIQAKIEEYPTEAYKPQALTPLSPSQTNAVPVKLNRVSSGRVRKRSHSDQAQRPWLMLSNLKDSRFAEVAQLIQQDKTGLESKAPAVSKDYMEIMFLKQALNSSYGNELTKLLGSSAKTLTTSDWMSNIREDRDCRIVKQIYKFQDRNRWSHRQFERSVEPKVPTTHLDVLLRDVKWLQTDFREERKLRHFVAQQLAEWCAEWVHADPDQRQKLQVRQKAQREITTDQSLLVSECTMNQSSKEESSASTHVPTVKEEEPSTVNPLAIFSAGAGYIPFDAEDDTDGALLANIPLYGTLAPSIMDTSIDKLTALESPLPSNRLAPKSEGTSAFTRDPNVLSPEDESCALFNPPKELVNLRSRLNVTYAFKPPGLTIPPQGFYEYRYPSQWTFEDEQQLRSCVRDFPANWALISDRLSSKSHFVPGADRRTPWECYERLLQMDPQNQDNNTRSYVKYFNHRLQQANMSFRNHQMALQQQAQQQAQSTGQQAPQVLRRFPTPIKVDRRPSRRFLAMLDAARRLARKREAAQNRQQQVPPSNNAPQPAPKGSDGKMPTPQQYSAMKHEREIKEQQRMEQQRQQQRAAVLEQQRRQQQAMQQNQQTLPANGIAHQTQQTRGVVPGMKPNQDQGNKTLAMQNGNGSRPTSQQGVANAAGMSGNNSLQPNGNMRSQQNMPNHQRFASHPNAASQMSSETIQRYMQQQQRIMQSQQQNSGQFNSSSPNMTSVNGAQSQTLMGQFNNQANGLYSDNAMSPNMNTTQGSPNMSQQVPNGAQRQGNQPQSLSSGVIPTVQSVMHDVQRQNPNMTPEQVSQAASERLQMMTLQVSRRNAINAASGVVSQQQQQQQQQRMNALQSQAQYLQQQAYQQNGLLPSKAAQGRSTSPAIATSNNQLQYQQHLRQQMLNQRQSMMSGQGSVGSPTNSNANLSPVMNMNMNGYSQNMGRSSTPTQAANGAMRPPSRTAVMDPGLQQNRPSSAQAQMGTPRLASQSPRPVSAQGTAQM